jgi:hypothetical protein
MKYNNSKNLKVIEVFKILQHLTLKNAMLIKSNIDIMNSCNDKDNFKDYKNLIKENNEITRINIGYIDLHNKLFSFIKSLENIQITDIDIINLLTENDDLDFDKKEYFNLTITDAISFDEEHPFFNDDSFRQELIDYFTKHEKYEKCIKLKNKK